MFVYEVLVRTKNGITCCSNFYVLRGYWSELRRLVRERLKWVYNIFYTVIAGTYKFVLTTG